jgi:drug/metabolite transporter (DMT)-like permease
VVFAFLFGSLWLGENVSGIQLAGAVLVIAGIVIAQLSSNPQSAIYWRKKK